MRSTPPATHRSKVHFWLCGFLSIHEALLPRVIAHEHVVLCRAGIAFCQLMNFSRLVAMADFLFRPGMSPDPLNVILVFLVDFDRYYSDMSSNNPCDLFRFRSESTRTIRFDLSLIHI